MKTTVTISYITTNESERRSERWTVRTGDLVTVFSDLDTAAEMIACLHEQILRERQDAPAEPADDGAARSTDGAA